MKERYCSAFTEDHQLVGYAYLPCVPVPGDEVRIGDRAWRVEKRRFGFKDPFGQKSADETSAVALIVAEVPLGEEWKQKPIVQTPSGKVGVRSMDALMTAVARGDPPEVIKALRAELGIGLESLTDL